LPKVAGAVARLDDHILPEVKVVAGSLVLILSVAFVILYLFPQTTGEHFAWKIAPTMTSLLMGAGYIGGAYFFARLLFAERWHWFTCGFIPITVFTWFEGLATFLHLDRFTQGHPAFYLWFVLYVVAPLLVPFLWFRNRAADPGTPDLNDAVVSAGVRWIAAILGGFYLAVGVALFLIPFFGTDALSIWPWKVSPLTMRVIGGWAALTGTAGLVLSRDPRWSAWRVPIEGQLLALLLTALGMVRAWSDLNPANLIAWAFIGASLFLLLAGVALYLSMEARSRRVSRATQMPS
jgi:hypothetical protein